MLSKMTPTRIGTLVCLLVLSLSDVVSYPAEKIEHITETNGTVWFPDNMSDEGVLSASDGHLLYWGLQNRKVQVLDLVKQQVTGLYDLPLPGNLIAVSPNGQYVAIAHNAYVTVISPHRSTPSKRTVTLTVPIEKACSLIVSDSGIVFVWAAYDQWTNIACVDSKTGHYELCNYQTYAGGRAWLDSTRKWIYSLTEGLSPQSIEKYLINGTCLTYLYDNPDFGTYDYGSYVWFSYDNSRIFLDNGRTLTTSGDKKTDMETRGCMNATCTGNGFTWLSQEPRPPYNIYGLRSRGKPSVINVYSWPYLNAVGNLMIPNQSAFGTTVDVVKPMKLRWWENSLYTIARYNVLGVGRVGIGKINMPKVSVKNVFLEKH